MELDPFSTLTEAANALEAGEITSRDLTSLILMRIELLNPTLNIYSYVLRETALQEADASDARRAVGKSLGKMDGIPIGIKDLIDTVPAICSAGLVHLNSYRPSCDALVVTRLRQAGAVVLGVVETGTGGFSTETLQVQNPIFFDRIAGGSSGGSAAAVAAGLAYATIGTDTGGSIRIPAACCAVFGFKPTFGQVPTRGVRPLANSFDHVGPLARSIEDLTIVQGVIAPGFINTMTELGEKPIRIGVVSDDGFCLDPSVETALMFANKRLAASGFKIKTVRVPNGHEVLPIHMVNVSVEAARYHQKQFPDMWKRYPKIASDTIAFGLQLSDKTLRHAAEGRDQLRASVDAVFDHVDLLLLPTLPIACPNRNDQEYVHCKRTLSKLEATIWNTAIFDQTSHPVVALNVFPEGQPYSTGLQLVGPMGSDARLLGLAKIVSEALQNSGRYTAWLREQNTSARVSPMNFPPV